MISSKKLQSELRTYMRQLTREHIALEKEQDNFIVGDKQYGKIQRQINKLENEMNRFYNIVDALPISPYNSN